MSGMSSILHILLYREAPSHHEPNERGNRRSGRYHPEKLFPSKSARCERIPGRPGWMPSMLLISLAFDPSVLDAGHARRIVQTEGPYRDSRDPSPVGSG
jgi:hypothetical protein